MIDVAIMLMLFAGVWLQQLCGTAGAYLPVTAIILFYLAAAGNRKRILLYAAVAGLLTDSLTGMFLPWNMIFLLLICLFAWYWTTHHPLQPIIGSFLPGILTAVIQIIPYSFNGFNFTNYSYFLLDQWLPLLVGSALYGAIAMPVTVMIGDYLAPKFGLPRYQDARKNQEGDTRRWQ